MNKCPKIIICIASTFHCNYRIFFKEYILENTTKTLKGCQFYIMNVSFSGLFFALMAVICPEQLLLETEGSSRVAVQHTELQCEGPVGIDIAQGHTFPLSRCSFDPVPDAVIGYF